MQLEWMIQLQNYRNDYLNLFFKFLNFFDTIYFIFILVPFIIIGISYRWGIKIYYLIITTGLINYGLKTLFKVPRPCRIIPDLALVNVGEYSFPSGAAQFSIILASLLIYFWKSPFAKVIGIAYVLLIGFSRVYLGVHYPSDVLVGWIVGLLIVMLFLKYNLTLEKKIKNNSFLSLILSLIFAITVMTMFANDKIMQFSSSFLAVVIGSYFTFKYNLYLPNSKKLFPSLIRGGIAILSTFILYFFLIQINVRQIPKIAILNFTLTMWIVLAVSPLIKKTFSCK